VGPSKKRIAVALKGFRETLLAFCETVLPNGHRSDHKWICGDLQDGEGKSCAVFLDTGGFNDTNPAADHVKGGPVDLWKAIFGMSSFMTVIKGMEAWVKDGTLPDGSKGVQTEGRIEAEGETITAQDDYERKQVSWIRTFQNWIAWTESHPNPYVNLPPGRMVYFDNTPVTEIDWPTRNAEKRKQYERMIEEKLSNIYAHRWEIVAGIAQETREGSARLLSQLRGLSREVFLWLIDNGYIAYTGSESLFPVFRTTKWAPEPEEVIQFLGMHIQYLTASGRKAWRYEPKGCVSEPLIIGDLATANLVVIGESSWDIVAFIDLRKLYLRGANKPWAVIATRGASNAGKVPEVLIKSDATLVLLLQNDANKANDAWYANLHDIVRARARLIVPPDDVKDLNDWIKAVGAHEVNEILNRK
jgi:hypothetical protein